MARISKEEYEKLKGLDKEWKWIARDVKESGFSDELWIYEYKPYKPERESNFWSTDDRALLVDSHLFQFIQWEDEEPHNIAELIKEYKFEVIKNKLGNLNKTMRKIVGNLVKDLTK